MLTEQPGVGKYHIFENKFLIMVFAIAILVLYRWGVGPTCLDLKVSIKYLKNVYGTVQCDCLPHPHLGQATNR
jgi:hypothetical protein